jgi:hypothetical protein
MKRRRLGSRSKRYKRRLPRVVRWSSAVLVGLAALVAVAYLHGNEPAANEKLLTSLHKTLAEPGVAALAGFAAALVVAWGVRHLILEYLAWRPGPIVAEDFAASPGVEGADAGRLTATFRDRLAFSHLQTAAPVPAPAQQGNFMDVLTAGGAGGGLLGSLLTLLRAAVPGHAYEVRGTLVSRTDPQGCGVTVHVVRASGGAEPGKTFWDSCWEDAIRRAADHATAAILPRTRLSRSPWSGWRGFELPSTLFHSYERAAELERERRYDEALDLYYKALEADPMNLGLRLQIGFLQEKLALFLDALATYQGIFEVARPGERPDASSDRPPDLLLTRRARRDRLRQFYRLPARRDRERVLLVAKYRRAVLLGGQELPKQWATRRSGSRAGRRDAQRHQLRKRLRPALRDLVRRADESRIGKGELRAVLAQPEQKGGSDLRRRFEELLVRSAIHELSELRRQLPRSRPRGDGELSRQAVDLARLWMKERLARTLSQPVLGADELSRRIRKIEGRARGFKRWQEHYNAACVYALPLLDTPKRDKEEVDALATLAVERLKRAIACADSGYVASRRDWLISDDPDLDGLRPEPAFKGFEAMYFPAAARTPRRPRDLHKWEVSRYTIDLLGATAERWEQAWRRRRDGLESDLDVAVPSEWLRIEASAWSRVRKVAINHRHWQSRIALVKDMRRWSLGHGLEPLAVQFPRFTEDDGPWRDEDGDKAPDVSRMVKAHGSRLESVAGTIERHNGRSGSCRLVDDLEHWQSELARLDPGAHPLSRLEAARVCESHAELWSALQGDLRHADKKLETAIEETARLWIWIVRRRSNGRPSAEDAA